ncbi:nucleotide exchange factor GrpE, partial [Vibrio vulnificus]|uniref:nucleotide exchange factor GrpE n=1 Tax=Vibrio vulnificus TaxID=672 RepID=UPI001F4D5D66
DLALHFNALGTVTAFNTVNVKPRVNGELVKVLFQEGQEVKAGDLLAVVDTLERGLEMSDHNDEANKPMREGMELTLKMFDDTLRR